MNIPQPIHDLAAALGNGPEVWLILVGLNFLGIVLQKTPVLPNRFNPFIPVLLYIMGIVLTVLLVPTTIFPAGQRHPAVLLGIIGFLIGFAAWFLHDVILQWVLKKYFPGGAPENPNDQNQNKP